MHHKQLEALEQYSDTLKQRVSRLLPESDTDIVRVFEVFPASGLVMMVVPSLGLLPLPHKLKVIINECDHSRMDELVLFAHQVLAPIDSPEALLTRLQVAAFFHKDSLYPFGMVKEECRISYRRQYGYGQLPHELVARVLELSDTTPPEVADALLEECLEAYYKGCI